MHSYIQDNVNNVTHICTIHGEYTLPCVTGSPFKTFNIQMENQFKFVLFDLNFLI